MEKEDNEEVRIQKLMEELVLMEQEFVFDNSQRVKDIIKHSSESIYGTPFSLQILSFERYSEIPKLKDPMFSIGNHH